MPGGVILGAQLVGVVPVLGEQFPVMWVLTLPGIRRLTRRSVLAASSSVAASRTRSAALLLATLVVGLQAGTYYIFACGVMPGLALGDDRTFVAAMQEFNVSFVNPWFLGMFLGAPLLALVAVVAHIGTPPATLAWVTAGFILAAATAVITMVIHIPLNDALDAAGPPDRIPDLRAVRAAHETSWVTWNVARTVIGTAALASLAFALQLSGGHGRRMPSGPDLDQF